MEQTCPTKHKSCAYEKENVLQWELELNSAWAAAKMWLLKGCTLKAKKNLGLSQCVTIPRKQISLPGQGIRK